MRGKLRVNKNAISGFLKYGLVGVIGTIVHSGMLALMVEVFEMHPIGGTIIGFVFSLVISYVLNSIWTFKQANSSTTIFVKYALVCSCGLLLNIFIMYITVDIFNLSYIIGQGVAIILVPIFNYMINRYWVFNENKT
ncbi:GtrA family protein [Paenibacillus arenosi]|uniref:GtrA family protein n=1 Tax=Paenibacillus arenosi TaxID=2774142 RepID=A0ABR9B3P9_9BACL|nr:GtrA family protein [Paenibacillus arenosi]MBD8500987.1 GtrA family protein [Paenibacillus arenosi]